MNKDIHLISLVERFPHLYNKNDAKYKDRTAIENSWLFISGELQIPTVDCIARWSSLRNRFSKERAKKTPSGSAAQTEWPLMKYLAFLHSVVKKRRTFGNITIEDESSSPLEIQDLDSHEDTGNLIEENNNSTQYIDYMYLDDETGTSTDIPSTEESLQSLSDILSEDTLALVRQQAKAKTPNTSTQQRPITPNTSTQQRPITPNTSTQQRPITPNTSTQQRPITPNTSIQQKPITPNTSIPQISVLSNTSISERPITSTSKQPTTANKSVPERPPITPNTSILKRCSQKRKSSGVEEQLGNAVDIFKSFVTPKNIVSTEDESLKYFCDSLYGDLKNLDKKDVISCKIEIMQIISRYTK